VNPRRLAVPPPHVSDLDEIRERLASVPDPMALLESLFAIAPIGLQIYRADGRSVLVNTAFLAMFGSQPPPEYNVLNDEIAERNGVLDLIHRAFRGETVRVPPVWYDPRELTQVKLEKGKRVAMESTFFPIFDRDRRVTHVAIAFRDLTAELTAREEAERERDLLRAVIAQTGDGILVADEKGVLRIANAAARQQHGTGAVDIPAGEWARTYGLEDESGAPLPLERTPLYRALHGESVIDARWLVRRPDGAVRHLAGTATPLRRPDGSSAGAVIVSRDETERVQRDREAGERAEFRERFIGVLGHDLRNPLSAIQASAQLMLRQEDATDACKRAAQRVVSSASRMERMIADLLDVTRARLGGGMPVQLRPGVDLGEVCRAAVEEASATGRRVEAELEPVSGRWDADRLAQLIGNLLANAVQYSPPERAVAVRLRRDGDHAVLTVSNEGPPIPAAELPRLFDPFRRGSQSTPGSGLGLGLYIVQAIAEAHGGHVAVTSTDERTTFTVTLPRESR
jgi:PAS domain S-box-containing protein